MEKDLKTNGFQTFPSGHRRKPRGNRYAYYFNAVFNEVKNLEISYWRYEADSWERK
ncbi:MAG: hypothetical protein Q8Q94_03625 [bacterium]|nr:hypothetical protein [bacterium]